MERVVEVREDPPEELAESNWPAKTGYEWVAADVPTQQSLFQWSHLLRSLLNCTPIFQKGVQRDIVAPERVTAIECVCHGREESAEEFFYMYMCHFSQLHIRLPFDEFTMGVLRLLNVAPTQLHPQLGVLTSFPVTMHGIVLGTVSSSILVLFCYEAEESDNVVVINKSAWSQQTRRFHSVVQAF